MPLSFHSLHPAPHRQFHKAVWSEQRYKELLSTSTESLASAQLDNTHQLSSSHQPSARRRLSSSFKFASHPMAIIGGESPQLLSSQVSSRQNVTPTTSPEGSVDGDGEAGDSLQQSNSSDNVFAELENSSLTFQPPYPSNRRNSIHSEHHTSTASLNTSPQVTKLCLRRPNPLISHTNGSRARSHSAFSTGREDFYSLLPNCSPLSRRATLALIGRQYHPGHGHAKGSLSPLATGHMTRTASGEQ